jgi:hypothetical protein
MCIQVRRRLKGHDTGVSASMPTLAPSSAEKTMRLRPLDPSLGGGFTVDEDLRPHDLKQLCQRR